MWIVVVVVESGKVINVFNAIAATVMTEKMFQLGEFSR